MTSVTFKTHPTPPLTAIQLVVASYNTSSPSVFPALAYLISHYPSLGDQGLSGYSYLFSSYPNPFDGGNTNVSGLLVSFVLQDTQDPAAITSLFDPILAHVTATWPDMVTLVTSVTTFPSFLGWYLENFDSSESGQDLYVGSRLLDADALTADLSASADAFRQFASGGTATAFLVSGKGVHDAQPRGGGDAVLPAWRKAYVHASKCEVPRTFFS